MSSIENSILNSLNVNGFVPWTLCLNMGAFVSADLFLDPFFTKKITDLLARVK